MAIAGWGSLILLASSLSGWRRLGTGSNSILAPFTGFRIVSAL
jgi:hypothetical protein